MVCKLQFSVQRFPSLQRGSKEVGLRMAPTVLFPPLQEAALLCSSQILQQLRGRGPQTSCGVPVVIIGLLLLLS